MRRGGSVVRVRVCCVLWVGVVEWAGAVKETFAPVEPRREKRRAEIETQKLLGTEELPSQIPSHVIPPGLPTGPQREPRFSTAQRPGKMIRG